MDDKEMPIRDEFHLINRLSEKFKSSQPETLVPNGDDAAIYLPRGMAQVVCVDTMIEGKHFLPETMSAEDIGYKCLAANLSDLAAMGAVPKYLLVSLSVAPHWKLEQLEGIYTGMQLLANAYNVELLGGDVVAANHETSLSITVIGEVEPEVRLLRAHARPGDMLFATGDLGSSAAGLQLLLQQREMDDKQTAPTSYIELIQAHQRPTPHIAQGRLFAAAAADGARIATNDISDGLASEAYELAAASQVDMLIEAERIPFHPKLTACAEKLGAKALDWALYGGEDFVLIGTCSPALYDKLEQAFIKQSLPLHHIGEVLAGNGNVFLKQGNQQSLLKKKGYNHFSD